MSEDAKQVVGCALLLTMLAIGLLGTGLAWVLTPDGIGWALVSLAVGILSSLLSCVVVVVAGRLFRRKAGA